MNSSNIESLCKKKKVCERRIDIIKNIVATLQSKNNR